MGLVWLAGNSSQLLACISSTEKHHQAKLVEKSLCCRKGITSCCSLDKKNVTATRSVPSNHHTLITLMGRIKLRCHILRFIPSSRWYEFINIKLNSAFHGIWEFFFHNLYKFQGRRRWIAPGDAKFWMNKKLSYLELYPMDCFPATNQNIKPAGISAKASKSHCAHFYIVNIFHLWRKSASLFPSTSLCLLWSKLCLYTEMCQPTEPRSSLGGGRG